MTAAELLAASGLTDAEVTAIEAEFALGAAAAASPRATVAFWRDFLESPA